MRFLASWVGTPRQSADPLEAQIAAAGPQFPMREPVQVDLTKGGLAHKFV